MISYTQIYKMLMLVILTIESNQIRTYLEVDPAMTPLGYSAVQAGAYTIFLSFFIASFFFALLDTGKLAILALSACLLVILYYPAMLFISAIVAGMAADIPLSLIAFLTFSILLFAMGLNQMKKESAWLTTFRITKWDCGVAVLLMLALSSVWISGLFGEHSIAFLNYYATFLYVVFAIMLVSVWQPKVLKLLPHLVFLWSILFAFLIVLFGYWQTGYLLTLIFHGVCAITYLYFMTKKRQAQLH